MPAPERLVAGGLPTEAMVASVIAAKYADHKPLYRQSALARQDIEIGWDVLAFWVGSFAAEVKPLWRLMRDELLASTVLFADKITAPVLEPGRGKTETGYMWRSLRISALGRDDPPAVVFTSAPGRGNENALELLKDFNGVTQCDGCGTYKALAKRRQSVSLSHCWAYVRRDFIDLSGRTPSPPKL